MYQQPPPYGWQPPVIMNGPAPGVSYGSRFGRLIASIVDSLIMSAVMGIPYAVVFGVLVGSARSDVAMSAGAGALVFVLILVVLAVAILWKPWFWSHGGQTPAYKLLGLRVVRAADGGPVGTGQALGRLFGYIVSGFVFDLGFIWIAFDDKHQGWHDKLAGTVVISA
jgi:uncharacterized RDD family membrane protein YckC